MMQLLRATAVLTAVLPALAIAAICDDTAIAPPDSVKANFNNIDKTFVALTEKYINQRWSVHRLRIQDAVELAPLECDSNEKCYFVSWAPSCYNEKTTVLRVDASLSLTLSNGDITIPGGAKANVFNNIKPIEEYLLSQVEPASSASDVTGKTSATGTAASVPTESASQSQSGTAAAPSQTSDESASQSQSGTAAAPSQTSDESAAGKMVVGGWVAAVAALAAVVVA